MAKGSKEHKISSKSNSKNKSEKNINPDNTNSDFNNMSNKKHIEKWEYISKFMFNIYCKMEKSLKNILLENCHNNYWIRKYL